jgi:prevent-host-death family protein
LLEEDAEVAIIAGKKSTGARTVTSEEVRLGLGDLINRVLYRSERVRVTRRGKPVMALVPLEDLEFMEKVLDALEDEIDLPVIKERLRSFEETGEGVPWKQVKAERGL